MDVRPARRRSLNERERHGERTVTVPGETHTVDTERKRFQALDLRAGGATYREIATQMDLSVAYSYQLVRDALAQLRRDAQEDADEARAIELRRLDAQYLRFLNKLLAQGALPDEATGLQLLRIAERRARLLGLDAPTASEISGPGGGPIPIAAVGVNATDVFLQRVDKLIARLEAGESAEALATEVRAGAPAADVAPSP